MKVVFTGGGTGGHIFPIIAVARELSRIFPQERKLKLFYIGPKNELTFTLLSQEGIKPKIISAGKIRRYPGIKPIFENIVDIFKTTVGIFQAFYYLFFLAPDLIFSKGGYGSFPAVITGKLLRIPVFLHESDKSSGLANRFLGKFSKETFISFPDTENVTYSKMILVGNPIRRELLEGSVEDAKKLFRITSEKPVVLILGGSQGAQRINNLILNILPDLLENFELIHQTGIKNFDEVKGEAGVVISESSKKYYHPVPFLKEVELKHVYKICDFVVSRAGSGSIFEIASLAKPSILIPLPESAQDHQTKNAYAYAKNNASLIIEEPNLTPYFFLATLKHLLSNSEELEIMQNAAEEFSRPRAGKIIASYILEYLSQ